MADRRHLLLDMRPARVAADGRLVAPLDEAQVDDALRRAHERGFRSVAAALMHGHCFTDHETAIGAIARRRRFAQISLSHEASPLIKMVARGDTAVVGAHLPPALRRHVGQVADAPGRAEGGGPRLMFMQSNGGLFDASLFQGRDAILSGPAGGVVGMARTAGGAGLDRPPIAAADR